MTTAFLFGLVLGILTGWLLLGIVVMVKWPKKSNESQGHLVGRG